MALACSEEPAAAAGSARSARLVLASVCVATFVVSLSTGNLNVAVPVIVRHFHASALTASLIVLVPSATSTALMATMGRLGDIVGRRTFYLSGPATSRGTGVSPSTCPATRSCSSGWAASS